MCLSFILFQSKNQIYIGGEMAMGRQFEKLRRNPVFGGRETGTCFDAYVSKDGERYRMDFSWRKKKSLAVTFSDDGINWDEPQVTLGPDEASGWEENVNRN